jgi:streptomycin 6-kinase
VPSRIVEAAARFGVTALAFAQQTPTSALYYGVHAGQRVVLKAPRSADEQAGARLLAAWRGLPVVTLVAGDDEVQLLEYLEPGTPLEAEVASLGDAAALRIVADLAAALHSSRVPVEGIPDVWSHGASLAHSSGPQWLAADLWRDARSTYDALAQTQVQVAVAHGDLHHGNVLRDARRGWIAIDPKGVRAELAFELACALRNPVSCLPAWLHDACVQRRLEMVSARAGVPAQRLAGWAFSQAVLSAIWGVEDGQDPAPWLAVAHAYRQLGARARAT